MPDALFADPRLARVYDAFDDERSDLDVYEALVAELGARTVLDVGCGTGSLAVRLAAAGLDVVGVDPAAASLDVARGKPGASSVTWVHGDATGLPADLDGTADLAIMTGNVAQVFVSDDEWLATLGAVRRVLRPDGRLVFETRDPGRRAWEGWTTSEPTVREVAGVGCVELTTEVVEVALPLVSFEHRYRFADDSADDSVDGSVDGEVVVSTSTLRFRTRDELVASLCAAGFAVREVRDAPDRPGLEWVFVSTVTPGLPEPSTAAS